jgi:hypothetical protein
MLLRMLCYAENVRKYYTKAKRYADSNNDNVNNNNKNKMVVICDVIKRIFENIEFYWFERKKKLYEEN